MQINRAFRYECKLNKAQRELFAKHAGTARFAYNWGLAQRIKLYEEEQKSTNAIEQHRALNKLKSDQFPWMYEVSKCAPQEALRDLDKAFKNFFRGLKGKRSTGFPKFKKKGFKDSFRLTGTIKVRTKTAQLPRIGEIRLKEETRVSGKILSATLSREADRWYVSFSVQVEIKDPLPVIGKPIGIDVGLSCFAVDSDGIKIHSPKPLNKKLKRLKRASKKHSRKLKGSKNRYKSALRLAKIHRKVRNERQDFLHKLSTKLAKTKSVIVVEDLDIKGLLQKNRCNRQIMDAGWGEFRRMLTYKTQWYGSQLIIAPKFFPSSKICSSCFVVEKEMPLSIRKWQCKACGIEHDRDINAARNLLNLSTRSSLGINACGDTSNGANQQFASYVSMKQEVMNGIFVHKL